MLQRTLMEIECLGGHPTLDFINTVHTRYADSDCDYLCTFDDFVTWHVLTGLVTKSSSMQILADAKSNPQASQAVFENGIELRELLYRIFYAVAHGKKQEQADINNLDTMYIKLRPYQHLVNNRQGVSLQWQIDPTRPESMLGPVTEGALQLLTSDKGKRVKECPAPDGCGWLFLDTSRNGSRCWCSMKNCGNLAKVRRHRKRNG